LKSEEASSTTAPTDKPPPVKVAVSEAAIRRVLLAFASHSQFGSPALDYCQGLNWVSEHRLLQCRIGLNDLALFLQLAAHALRWLGEADAFALLTSLIHRLLPRDYYTDLAGAARDQTVLGEVGDHISLLSCITCILCPLYLQLAQMSLAPVMTVLAKISGGSVQAGVSLRLPYLKHLTLPSVSLQAQTLTSVTLKWFMCLFTLPFRAAVTDRVWDSLLFEGDPLGRIFMGG
jgi:hypothetical protein